MSRMSFTTLADRLQSAYQGWLEAPMAAALARRVLEMVPETISRLRSVGTLLESVELVMKSTQAQNADLREQNLQLQGALRTLLEEVDATAQRGLPFRDNRIMRACREHAREVLAGAPAGPSPHLIEASAQNAALRQEVAQLQHDLRLIEVQDEGCGGRVTEAEAWRSAQKLAREARAASLANFPATP